MKRQIINIDESKCDGCGLCIPACPEGAIQLIDGKARLVSDLCCDGLGACLGDCPQGAITLEEREAEPYNERKVMENIVPKGANTIRAHLDHLKEHGEFDYLEEALDYLREHNIPVPPPAHQHQGGHHHAGGGCPGSQTLAFQDEPANEGPVAEQPSALRHWPIQMHLISPNAPHYREADLVLAADCVAFSMGNFHNKYLKGKTLAIACPKLDEGQEIYLEKLKMLIDQARINTLTVMIMQVPCCGGLLRMAQMALSQTERKIPLKYVVVGLQGEILQEDWLNMN
ncbi:MAG: 4Fe-4S binding protein [Calditrichia bacterium]